MQTIEYLTGPSAALFWPGVIVGIGIAVMCAPLSVLVVLKRLSFIGQGVSHAALGGFGVAAFLGLAAGPAQFAVVLGFCVLAALGIGWLGERKTTRTDTAIGIVLVASMSLGVILLQLKKETAAWESLLFGSIWSVSSLDAAIGWVAAGVVLGVLWWNRRPMIFWAFDAPVSQAFGVRNGAMKYALMALLALAVVTAMKLAGVVLATALLVLPGAAALQISDRLMRVMMLSSVVALLGVLGGLVVCFELDLPPGPCIVLVLVVLFGVARVVGGWGKAGQSADAAPA